MTSLRHPPNSYDPSFSHSLSLLLPTAPYYPTGTIVHLPHFTVGNLLFQDPPPFQTIRGPFSATYNQPLMIRPLVLMYCPQKPARS